MDYIKSRYEVVEGQIDAAITNQPFVAMRGEGDADRVGQGQVC